MTLMGWATGVPQEYTSVLSKAVKRREQHKDTSVLTEGCKRLRQAGVPSNHV